MIRKMRFFGVALIAALALVATSASAASAAPEFHAIASPTIFQGTQVGNFTFDAAGDTLTCKKQSLSGTATGTSFTVLGVEAGFSDCSYFGVATTVAMNGCMFQFMANGQFNIVSRPVHTCSTEQIAFKATVLGLPCTVQIGPQSQLQSVSYDSVGFAQANATITFTPTIAKIAYQQSGALCGSHADGEITTGSTLVKGFADLSGVPGSQGAVWWTS